MKRPRVAFPTVTALAHEDRLPVSSPIVVRILNRLSRSALLTVVLQWLSDEHQLTCAPYLLSPPSLRQQGVYPAESSIEDLREVYHRMQERKGTKKDVVDRIVEGDWVSKSSRLHRGLIYRTFTDDMTRQRHGLTLIQLAMADVQCKNY